jgi:hypothetical protein
MSLERVFARIVFYIIEVAFKGLTAYLAYCGLNAFTGNGLGSFYMAISLFCLLIILGWDSSFNLAEEAVCQYEAETEESE